MISVGCVNKADLKSNNMFEFRTDCMRTHTLPVVLEGKKCFI